MLHIHNTLTRQKEEFKPIDKNNVRLYACGPTVYDFAHLGNARAVVVFDTLFRLLRRIYGDNHVTYVRNITDIDDKIMVKAKETDEPIDAITTRTTQAFHDDMAALNALPPTTEPRATQYIPEMQAMIATLIAKGHAYAAEGHVLFNVPSMPDYGTLSKSTRDEMIAGARVEVAPYKKDPADFILWKPSSPDQVGWDSPWGRGRPGWHIECSAMAEKNLGVTFDIHGGGLDLRFPHHENEIAQSCCAHDGAPLANYWMHNGFLMVDGEKMSKSLGNFFTVRDLLQTHQGETIRLALLSSHYRQPLDFSKEALQSAKATLDKWYRNLQKLPPHAGDHPYSDDTVSPAVEQALLDDLNTPLAIKSINDLFIMTTLYTHPTSPRPSKARIIASAKPLGLLQQNPEDWFKWQPANQSTISESDIQKQINARTAARAAKNFAESDRIRDALAAQGVILEDKPNMPTTWRRG